MANRARTGGVPSATIQVLDRRRRPVSARPTADEVDRCVEAAYLAHAASLQRFALTMVRDHDVAEDVVQEAFVRLVGEVSAGRAPERTGAWLHRVCANVAVSRARRGSSLRQALPRLVDDAVARSPEDVAERHDHHAQVLEALTELPADARAVLLLAADGFGSGEIGPLIGRTPQATRTYLSRMRLRLRQALSA